MRQNAAAMLHEQAQSHREEAVAMLHGQAQSHREEASIALGYVNNLTEATLNKLNKQSQERQQMAANGERTRQRITALNELRNQEKEQDSPDRAKPKAKSEPKPNPIFKITGPLVMETPHAPKKHILRILY